LHLWAQHAAAYGKMETSFMYGGANMAVCIECGKEFDVAAVRRKLSREYYKGVYDDQYPDANVCYDCALPDISASWGTGEDQIKDMGSGWDPD